MSVCKTTYTVRAALAAALFTAAGVAAADQGHEHERQNGDEPSHGAATALDAAVIYHDYCSVCHGDRGDGDSRARGSMIPPPRDFTSPQARSLTRQGMIAAVAKGKAGTAMAPWETQLSVAEIGAVVDYIRDTFIAPLETASTDEGARVYQRTCSVCHGDNGSGAMWAASNLNPQPRDFTTTRAAAELSRQRMIHSVTFGRPDTAMPGFGTQLDEQQIEAVVDFVRRTFMRSSAMGTASAPGAASVTPEPSGTHAGGAHASAGRGHEAATGGGHEDTSHGHANATHGHDSAGHAGGGSGHDHDAHLGTADAHAEPFPDGLVGNVSRGEELYRANCVACHGEQGNGQGPRAYFILPKPRNFTHPASRSAYNRPHLFSAIARGKVGSEMAAWDTVLDDQSIADVAEYVYQRFILNKIPQALGLATDVAAGR